MNKTLFFSILTLFGASLWVSAQPKNTSTFMVHSTLQNMERSPSYREWTFGAIVFGRIAEETLQLNEQTL
jgi:hypothetical protein